MAKGGDDCDDSDPNTYPGVATFDSTTLCMRDADGDGYGDLNAPSGGMSEVIVMIPIQQFIQQPRISTGMASTKIATKTTTMVLLHWWPDMIPSAGLRISKRLSVGVRETMMSSFLEWILL